MRRQEWPLSLLVLIGAVAGAVVGFAMSWLDYGRMDVGFMFNWVLGLAAIGAAVGFGAALIRNWMIRNPMG